MTSRLANKYLLETVVFVSGALVMIYEIVGSRILAPYIGTSTYVWTSLIGVILASLSLGYWLGGKMADRQPELKHLAGVMFFAAAMLSATILLHELVLTVLAVSALGLEIKSILAALILFAPASVLFGFVTPYAVRLKMLSVADAGKTVGRLYALSTVGSILGTFAAGFFLLPFVGSLRTLVVDPGNPAAEVFVVDARFSLVDKSTGRLETPLRCGLYKVKTRVGRALDSRVIFLDRDCSLGDETPKVSLAAPLPGTASTHEYHEGAVAAHLNHVRT